MKTYKKLKIIRLSITHHRMLWPKKNCIIEYPKESFKGVYGGLPPHMPFYSLS